MGAPGLTGYAWGRGEVFLAVSLRNRALGAREQPPGGVVAQLSHLAGLSDLRRQSKVGVPLVSVNRHGRHKNENTLVRAWGFVAVINRFRFKVVVQQIGNGKKQFYSVIPAWKTRQYRDIKMIETAPTGGVRHESDEDILKNATQGGAS